MQTLSKTVHLLAVLAFMLSCLPARGQCARWLPGIEGMPLDGSINAVVRWDPDGPGPLKERLVIGGTFTNIGTRPFSRLAAWDGERWLQIGSADAEVTSLIVHNGELVAAGAFTTIDGTVARCIAASNGQTWRALATSVTPSTAVIRALTVHEGRIVAGGTFTSMNGNARTNIATFDGSLWLPFGTGILSAVSCVHVFNGILHAGGPLNQSAGPVISCVVRWNGTAWTSVGASTSVSSGVLAMATFDGVLYAGGNFSIPGPGTSSTSTTLASLQAGMWVPVPDAPPTGTVRSLYASATKLYFGGNFSVAGNFVSNLIGAWNGAFAETLDGGLNADFGLGLGVTDIDEYDGELVAVGQFSRSFTNANTMNIGFYGPAGWRAITASPNDSILCTAVYRGDLYFGGEFSSAGGVSASGVVGWNGVRWSSLGSGVAWIGSTSSQPVIRAMAIHEDRLIVGGTFNVAGNWICNNVAAWDGTEWQPLGPGLNGAVDALCVHNGQLYASGAFFQSGLNNLPGRIARWTGTSWVPVGSLLVSGASSSQLRALISFNNMLYHFGGSYAFVFDGTDWVTLFPNQPLTITCAAVHNNELYVGGAFSATQPQQLRSIAKLTGSSWVDVGGGLSAGAFQTAQVNALCSYNGRLYAGGEFSLASGLPANRIASFNGMSWEAIGAGATGAVRTLAPYGGDLVLGGDFSATGTTLANFWSRYTSDGRPAVVGERLPPVLSIGSSLTLAVTVLPGHDLNGPLQFQWTRGGTPLTDGSGGPGGFVSGASTRQLIISDVQFGDAGEYACAVTNACGTRIHQAGTVDVVFICRADLDGSGALESSDIFVFLNAWFTGSIQGDFDRDGDRDPADIFAFLNAYFAGC